MTIRCLTIDAFASEPFSGNPAAVCLLEGEADPRWMQAVAAEMNLSETAFVRPLEDGFGLRWFTPVAEVDLCGHATLAAAHALWSEAVVPAGQTIAFHTRSGVLTGTGTSGCIRLDFPATPVSETPAPDGLIEALAVEPSFVGASAFDAMVLIDSAAVLRSMAPDLGVLARLPVRGVIVTSPSDDGRFDFLSRFFAPGLGVAEDPVTGSAHCALAPFWGGRLGKSALTGFQASRRGGVVDMQLADGRVELGGTAVTVMRGVLLGATGSRV